MKGNGSFETAYTVEFNKTYRAQMADTEQADFYRFTVSSRLPITLDGISEVYSMTINLYDAEGRRLEDRVVYKGSQHVVSFNYEKELDPGTYYLAVGKSQYYTGNYKFAIKKPHYHSYHPYIRKATPDRNGYRAERCSCGSIRNKKIIYYPERIRLSGTTYEYDGKTKTPGVKVIGSNGKEISKSNYTLTYSAGRKSIGRYGVRVTFKGKYYTGSVLKSFSIVPKGTSISKVKALKKGVKVYIRSQRRETSGYQLQISSGRKFKKGKTYTLGNRTKTKTIKGLKSVKKYYVRVRTFRKTGGRTYVSPWSSAKYTVTKR